MTRAEEQKIQELHRKAIDLADKGFLARREGRQSEAATFIRQAFEKELSAADAVASELQLEPTRSVLHRSAASLAFQCGELETSERLIHDALSGSPPEEIAEELHDLLTQISSYRSHAVQTGAQPVPFLEGR